MKCKISLDIIFTLARPPQLLVVVATGGDEGGRGTTWPRGNGCNIRLKTLKYWNTNGVILPDGWLGYLLLWWTENHLSNIVSSMNSRLIYFLNWDHSTCKYQLVINQITPGTNISVLHLQFRPIGHFASPPTNCRQRFICSVAELSSWGCIFEW